MNIDFSQERWSKVQENYENWWEGNLDRPLIQAVISGRDPGRAEPEIPQYKYPTFYDDSVSDEQIVDRWEYDLSQFKFLGDSFPSVWPNYGAGVAAALLGARLDPQIEGNTVWFHAPKDQEISEIEFQYDPANKWLRRIKSIMHLAAEKFGSAVQIGMTDLGGALDIISSFRPGEKLLFDLYDTPEAVEKLTWQTHELWWKFFCEFDAVLRPTNPGYTAWSPILSKKSYYMLQCDFCYMISPEMFDRFVKPELAALCEKLERPFYHLDGPGELPHLDSLLEIENLKGVQWIPGTGSKPITEWPEVFKKIHKAGKLIQFFGQIEDLEIIADQIGTTKGIILIGPGGGPEKEEEILAGLEKFGVI